MVAESIFPGSIFPVVKHGLCAILLIACLCNQALAQTDEGVPDGLEIEQAAHFARKYGELQLPELARLLSATALDGDSVGLLRDGTEALVGVLAIVTGGELVDADLPMQ